MTLQESAMQRSRVDARRCLITKAVMGITGIVTVLVAAFVDTEGLGVVPGWVYAFGDLFILAAILPKSFTLKRLAIAIAVLALALRVSYSGMSSLGHRLYTVKTGMTVDEARRKMAAFKEGSGLTDPYTGKEFTAAGALIFRDPAASDGDQTWGVVVIDKGRVVDVFFSPD